MAHEVAVAIIANLGRSPSKIEPMEFSKYQTALYLLDIVAWLIMEVVAN